jgi:SHS2 domain-containing protein
MTNAYWEHYSHPADIGIRGFGPTKEEAFAQAALALTAIIADLKTVEPKEEVKISCQEQDDELLFVDWLNALIYEMATRQMLFSRFEVRIDEPAVKPRLTPAPVAGGPSGTGPEAKAPPFTRGLSARVFGEKIDVKKHSPAVEVKAATYTDLKVGQDKNGDWVVQCVVDV